MTEVQTWLSTNIENTRLNDDHTYPAISDFCVMWAIFECTQLADARVAVDELAYIACRLERNNVDFQEQIEFWKNRYIDNDITNARFEKLGFTYEPHKELVSGVLLGNQTDSVKINHAILLIVYRLRNNLFHGNKDITRIHHQVENLNMASKALTNAVSASGRHVYLGSA